MNVKRLLAAMVLPLVFFALPALSQEKMVTGKVTDSKDGSTMANATVRVKGTDVATQTDAKGNFKIRVPVTATTLEVSSIGYTLQDVIITDATVIIQLVQSSAALSEIVVIGYGTRSRKDVTGSVATVGVKNFQQGNINTPEQLIAGKVAGVSITSNGGQPGQGSTIRIRGGASLNASNDPLIVIDGIPLSGDAISGVSNQMALINSDDIETFTVLKDAASTAIYGSRASNGVLLITTKKGRKGKPVINFNTQFSVSSIEKYVDLLSADQIRTYIKANDATTGGTYIHLLGTANTDWQKEIYRTGIGSASNLSITGAYKALPYRISIGFNDQTGILKTDHFQRVTGAVRLNPVLFDNHLKVDFNLNGSYSASHFGNQDAISSALNMDPTQPVYDKKNTLFGGYYEWMTDPTHPMALATHNPVAQLYQKNDLGYGERSWGNVQLDYKFHFLPDLHANWNVGYDVSKGHGHNDQPITSRDAWANGGTHTKYEQKATNVVSEFYLNYVKDLKAIRSNINATAGYGYYGFKTTGYNYPTLNDAGSVTSTPAYATDPQEHNMLSFYGRLIYTYADKYIVQGSIRSDQSSRFSKDQRKGTFPGLSVAWKLNQESFLRNVSAISELKLRASYGVTGQQDGIGNYTFVPYYSSSPNYSEVQFGNSYYTMTTANAYNNSLKWEQTESYNYGVDFGLLKGRISGSVDYYLKKTKDLLNITPIPAGTNFSNTVTGNVGNIENKGIEIVLNATLIRTKNFSWDIGFNYAHNNLKVTKLTAAYDSSYVGTVAGDDIDGGTGNKIMIHSIGYEPFGFFVYKQVYDKATGKPIDGAFEDLNHDGVINESDLYHYKSRNPKDIFGFTTSLGYMKWTLSTVLRANVGNYLFNNVAYNRGRVNHIMDPNVYIMNASSEIYKSGFSGLVTNESQSDYFIQNASFLKMDMVNLAYNIGKIFNNKANLRANVNVQNVFTITKYKGIDPEQFSGIDNKIYPRPRIVSLGVNLDF
jgi:TonB-linked SusC/RagA family outer membrane protein